MGVPIGYPTADEFEADTLSGAETFPVQDADFRTRPAAIDDLVAAAVGDVVDDAVDTAFDTKLPGWTFAEDGAKNLGQAVTDGQFYFRQMDAPAAFRAQGLGSITGFMCSAFQTPVQFVFHRGEGTGETGEELPVGDNTNLFVWDQRGTINLSDGQASAFHMRVTTKESAAVTGFIGSTVKLWVAPLGGSVSVANPATLSIDDDDGLSYKGVQFVDGDGVVVGGGSSTVEVEAEGVQIVAAAATLNFTGAGVAVTDVAGVATIAIAGGGPNYIANPSMDYWQAATSFAPAANTDTFLADRYKTRRAAIGVTHSRQTGFSGADYCIRMARDNGNTSVQALLLFQQFDPELVRQLAGKTLYVSYDARVGADYSGGALVASFYSGTAGGESVTMVGGSAGFATGGVAGANINMGTPTTTAGRMTGLTSYAVPADALDLAWRTYWAPTGTAGAADYLEITNIRVAESGTTFIPAVQSVDLAEVLRFYRTSTLRFPALTAGATTQRSQTLYFGGLMRATPTITLASTASGDQVRDATAGADCSATASANVTTAGFDVFCTGNASTAAGNELAVVWTADARI